MFFVGKINLVFYIWALLVLSIIIPHVYAHGGVNDGDGETGNTQSVPSVFAGDDSKKGTLASGNVSLGFGLTVMAALASALGSLTPFLDILFSHIPFLSHIKITESKGFIAGSLAFSSGILLSLTLGDLFPEAISSFRASNLFNKKYASLVASSIFIFTALLIIISKHFIREFRKKRKNQSDEILTHNATNVYEKRTTGSEGSESEGSDQIISVEDCVIDPKNAKRFKHLSIQVAVALAVHNFPEGLATFATTIKDSNIGIIFAIGLALHKIPEGLIISLPIYCATGSRWIAFAIAATVGIISQMLGAVLGYVLFVTVWNDAVPGVIFSIVTAALLYAILHGMLPMAHHYDPKDKYVTNYIFAGLFFFAIVSSLFSIAEG